MIHVQVCSQVFDLAVAPVVDVQHQSCATARDAVLLAGGADPAVDALLWRNRQRIEACTALEDGDWVVCIQRPGLQALPVWASQLIISALVAVASFIIQLIFAPSRSAIERDDEASPTHGFGPTSAVRQEGLPRPIALGEFRTGGHIISEYVSAVGFPPVVTYHALALLSEGECESVDGISEDTPNDQPLSSDAGTLPQDFQINGNVAANLDGVELYIRTGRNEQEPIPGFEQTPQQSQVGLALLQEETTNDDNSGIVITDPTGTGDDAIWDAWGEKFTVLDAEADAFRVLLTFPQGLYRLDNAGNLIASTVQVQIRYREIDALDAEITTGGPNGDGWVRLLPETRVLGPIQGSFPVQYQHTFFDPQTFPGHTIGRALSSSGASTEGAQLNVSAANFPASWTPSAAIEAISFEFWIGIRAGSLPTGSPDPKTILDWTTGGNRGMRVEIRRLTFGGTTARSVPRVTFGNGAQSTNEGEPQSDQPSFYFVAPPDDTEPLPWHHIVIVYRHIVDGLVVNRMEMYANGVRIASRNLGFQPTVPAAGWNWNVLTTGAIGGRFRLDETTLWARGLLDHEVVARFNGGQGVFGATDAALVMGHHFESTSASSPDFSPNNNVLTIFGGATAGIAQGVVPNTSLGTPKRSRYAVEVLRINRDSTSPRTIDDCEFSALVTLLDAQFAYPNSCLAGIRVRASDQLGSATPNPTHLVRGIKVPVWDGVSTAAPNFEYRWTRNCAWQTLGLLTHQRYGLGHRYALSDVLLESFIEWAQRNDELVRDSLHIITTDGGEILNAQFDSTTVDPATGTVRGSILIILNLGEAIPEHWMAGGFVRIDGFPLPADDPAILNDINSADLEGYEIHSTAETPTPRVRLYWDRLDETDPWTDGQLINTLISPDTLSDYSVEIQGVERRHETDTVLDIERYAWDTLNELAASSRAVLAPLVGKVRVIAELPRPITGMISRRDIVPGSFEFAWGPRRTRKNVIDLQFRDRAQNYERSSTGPIEGASLVDDTTFANYRVQNAEQRGTTRRSEALRQARFMLNVNEYLIRTAKMTLDKSSLMVLVGKRVLVAHDLLPRGTSGHMIEDSPDESTVIVDSTVVIAGAESWLLYTTHPSTGAVETVAVSSGAGTYEPGDEIELATPLTFEPKKRHPYILCRAGDELSMTVGRTGIAQDLGMAVELVEYSELIFNEEVETSLIQESIAATSNAPTTDWTIPERVENLGARILTSSSVAGGALTPVLHVSWTHAASTAHLVAGTVLEITINGARAFSRTVQGLDATAAIAIPSLVRGDSVEVRAMAVSARGARYGLKRSPAVSVAWSGTDGAPPAPTNVSASWQGDLVTIQWDMPEDARGCSVVCRRGNWILGTPVFESAPGADSFGPLPWSDGRLELRCRDALGRYSPAALLELEIEADTNDELLDVGYQTQEWESWEDGWDDTGAGGSDPDTTLDGCEVDADGYLTMSAGFLDATWTSVDALAQRTRDNKVYRRVLYLSAWADSLLDWPLTGEEAEFVAGDPRAAQMTAQGPLNQTRVKLWIEFRISGDGTAWGAWQRYRAQSVQSVGAQWRLRMTRDAEDVNLRVLAFHTRATGRRPTLYDRTPEQTYLHEETF